ncbi:helix-turn-helix domain-containing protein [Fusibacter sp. JL216-2]|uniref:helix-turn-helix domain-containing protein n=1 Tax=Fusibacter sp. JL216-2 TaxID=3071453 RepID=UPI003D335E07
MKDVLVVDDLAQLKAMSNSYRIQIIHAFEDEPATAKQISEKLGEPHSKVNYHLKTLEKVGIIRLVCEKPKYGVIEKYYEPVAKTFVLDSKSMQSDEKLAQTMDKASMALFDRVAKDFYQANEAKKINTSKESTKGQYINYNSEYYLSKQEANELHNELCAFIKERLSEKESKSEGKERYSISTVISPLVSKVR